MRTWPISMQILSIILSCTLAVCPVSAMALGTQISVDYRTQMAGFNSSSLVIMYLNAETKKSYSMSCLFAS